MNQEIMKRLRELAFERFFRSRGLSDLPIDVVPLVRSTEGWYCIDADRSVFHISEDGEREPVVDHRQATAFVGHLSRSVPLASALLANDLEAMVCEGCNGTGTMSWVPENMVGNVNCRCGGIGWRPK